MGDDENVVRITPADMYQVMIGMREDVLRMTSKLDGVLDASKDHEARIRRLEDADFVTRGDLHGKSGHLVQIICAVAAAISAAVAVIALMVQH